MTLEHSTEMLDGGDVLIIGGGATGLLVALAVSSGGLSFTLVEADGVGAGQSNHSHGYMHRGYAYIEGSSALIRCLSDGAARWTELFAEYEVGPVTRWSAIAFSNALVAATATHKWNQLSLPVVPMEAPPWLAASGQFVRLFRTEEPAYDFHHVLRELRGALPPGRIVQGEARMLHRRGEYVTGVDIAVGDQVHRFVAGNVVLAAGAENEALMRTVTTHRGRAISRMSYMLVLRSPSLPRASLICPEPMHYGCFLVSRTHRERAVWLVSNFLSYARLEQSTIAKGNWLRATLDRLGAVYPWEDDPELELGIYEAPKMELRSQPGVISPHAAEAYGFANLTVAAPTKLTLVPLLAEEVAMKVRRGRRYDNRRARPIATTELMAADDWPVLQERWQYVPMESPKRFLETHAVW